MINRKIYTTQLDGADLSLEFSELAGQANGAVIGRWGDTAVLAAVVMGSKDTAGDYFPLTVDFEERFYAAGKILGSRFVRREGKASDDAILSARLIDRTIRPLFDARLRREVQLTVTVLEYDEAHNPDVIALIAASAALAVSDIPWDGPVAGVERIAGTRGENGFHAAFFAGTKERVNMIEFEGVEVAESDAEKIFADAFAKISELIAFQEKIVAERGKPKAEIALTSPSPELTAAVHAFIEPKIAEAAAKRGIEDLKHETFKTFTDAEHAPHGTENEIEYLFETYVDGYVHREAIQNGRRVDGRKFDQIRDLYGEVATLKKTHGSAIFVRGQTQVLSVTTLGSTAAEQLIETMEYTGTKRFMLHYNFPSFSTGEAKRSRGPGRREIGHGNLAWKALANMIPPKEVFPYTIRVVAETLSSNGSSSMATTCASCLSLMDAGVPIKKMVAGIAIGLMSDDSGAYRILTDIQGPEDHYGDMDFKVTGTKDGITAVQMDVKIGGINAKMFSEALAAAKTARLQILSVMEQALPAPRAHVSPYAPTILSLPIAGEKIGLLIGPGGKTINGIIAACGGSVAIDIDESPIPGNPSKVFVSGTDREMVKKAFGIVEGLIKDYTVGDVVEGPIIKILEFGAIVDLGGGRDGMIHVSELKDGFVKKVEDVVHLGDTVKAKVVRAEDGRIALSLKALQPPAPQA